MAIDRRRIASELTTLGLRKGDVVMMHSSLSSLGKVEGGADTVVDALLDALGPKGTIIVPAFRDSVWENGQNFACTDCNCDSPDGLCPSQQMGFQGIIPETIRLRQGSRRSCHPTHSWVALGAYAEIALWEHRQSSTPCGLGNPFDALVRLDGCILTLGVQVDRVTLWHYYEEVLQVPYMGHYWPRERHLNHCVPGKRLQYTYPGILHEVVRAAGVLHTGPVGKSESGIMRAREFQRFMSAAMADDPYCFVLRPPERDNGDLAVDALRKAAGMLNAWRRTPEATPRRFDRTPRPVPIPGADAVVRRDCPAFVGFQLAEGNPVPLCRANDRHPALFRHGGDFARFGVTTCAECSWNERFPYRLQKNIEFPNRTLPRKGDTERQ